MFTDVLHNNAYIDSVEAFSHGYSETGLFGVKLSGSSANVKNVFENAVNSLRSLQNIKKGEFESARSTLSRYLHEYWQFPKYRLEYYARDLHTNQPPRKDYVDELNSVSLEDVQ